MRTLGADAMRARSSADPADVEKDDTTVET